VVSRFKAAGIRNECLYSHGDNSANARDSREAPHLIILLGLDDDLTFELVDLCGEHLNLIDNFGQGKAHSSGGKERLGRISKMGNPVLRSLLTTGAASVLRHVQYRDRVWPWLKNMLTRRPFKVVAVALANKIARMIWALLTRGGVYRDPIGIEAGSVAA